eukprot:TRINITY_DN65478_c0_g1_i1.p1 TRINITY_DN65478_c0_g1~~TRINITY_DN65478_c0_g1_i1.p1  ORF type:complete len:212 (+),score=24.99 TRINITY_DN65478_c0_g1_i1:55-636(+)
MHHDRRNHSSTDCCLPFIACVGCVNALAHADMEWFLARTQRRANSQTVAMPADLSARLNAEGKSCILCDGRCVQTEISLSNTPDFTFSSSFSSDSQLLLEDHPVSASSQSAAGQSRKIRQRQHEEELQEMIDNCSKDPAGFVAQVKRKRSRRGHHVAISKLAANDARTIKFLSTPLSSSKYASGGSTTSVLSQ